MLALLTKAKGYAAAIIVGIGLALLAALKYLSERLEHVKAERDALRAEKDFKEDVAEQDAEISAEYTDIRERAKADIKEGKVPANLSNPDQW